MKSRFPHRQFLIAVLALAVVYGCATTAVKSIQRTPEFQCTKIHHVLVLSLNKNTVTRETVEDEFVRQWRLRGVDALPSHEVLPPGTLLEKSAVAPIAQQHHFDTVMVSRLLGQSKIDPHIRGEAFDAESSTDNATLTQYFQAVVASPEYSQDYQLAVVTANLYDVQTEKRIWSGTSQVLLMDDLPKLIRSYVKTILKTIYQKD